MVNLLKGYKAITDGQFKQYISQKINEYDSGGHVKEERLMILSQNKNKMLVRSGEWQTPIEDQKEILAMQAQVDDMNKKKESNQNKKVWVEEEGPTQPQGG